MNSVVNFNVYLNTLRLKGYLAYEYNPLHNFQTDVDLYKIDDTYIVPANHAVNPKNGEILVWKNDAWVDKRGNIIPTNKVRIPTSDDLWAKAGSLIDLDTEQLNFDLDHPVEIEVLPSYDGSVNLILNDDKNIPRLINSRFSVREKDTYEIVDRIGENDTNIYNSRTFDKDSSLYFQYEDNPLITYLGFVKGVLQVGLYCFYFTYCDADDNESDIIAESGLIPVFIGSDKDPMSMDGGIKNQNSNKGIRLRLNNIDKSYNYLKIYYVRYFADYLLNRVYECKKIYLKYPINSNTLYIQVTGNEQAEDLDANILNLSKFNPKSILTLALCKNMLFFGNIVKNADNYKELTDLALRIVPELNVVENFENLDNNYNSSSGDYAYYNSVNIYNKTGYFNQEYYRFGVVFIYLNGTLSNVYNTLGGTLSLSNKIELDGELYTKDPALPILVRNYIKSDNFGWITENDLSTLLGDNLNARGVCLINHTGKYDDKTIFSVRFKVPAKVSKFLKEDLGIRGLFFVRQKCVPNILALCYLLSMDELLEVPILEVGDTDKTYYTERFLNDDRKVTNNYRSRLYEYKKKNNVSSRSNQAFAGICPDFLLNQPYYNLIFNGSKFRLLEISCSNSYLKNDERFYNEEEGTQYLISSAYKKVTITTVTENVSTVALHDKVYKLEVGKLEEAFRFGYAEFDNGAYSIGESSSTEDVEKATNLVRGVYSPYLAIYSNSGKLKTGCLYNILLDSSNNIRQEFQNRMDSSEPFYAISDRYNLVIENLEFDCWRGDCYINQFTFRLNRNFNDPSLPNNDEIIDRKTWEDHYKVDDLEEWEKISRSDLNAVRMGSWITFRVRSAMNYALRSVDHSYVGEEALMGAPRSFYPRSHLLARGANKLPDSYLYNDAYRASLGFKCYFTLQDVNYIKDTFSNRIQYSAISIQDSYKNNYRESLSTYYRDYSQEYGSIQKLVGFEGYLLVIFEHGIGIAVVNERVLAGTGDGEPVFINTQNVLPEELTIITDTYGTLWGDSVVKSEAGYVYGVDTIAKKIWRVKGQQIELISDFKVNKFLIDNITLGERELYPTIGLKNVKTHYNNNKKDIIFTFYDDVYLDEEKAWSLCYNELLSEFVTFYSWIPSYSENIDTKFFTFNRDTAKKLALLGKCNYSVLENTGVLLDNPVCPADYNNENETELDIILLPNVYYVTVNKSNMVNYTVITNEDGATEMRTVSIDSVKNLYNLYIMPGVVFRIEKDHWLNYKFFKYDKTSRSLALNLENFSSYVELMNLLSKAFLYLKVLLLYLTPEIEYISSIVLNTTAKTCFNTEVVAITLDSIVKNPLLTYEEKNRAGLTTDFYLHGQAGIFNVAENLYPTHWYGEYHPFEFEFIVNDKITQLKIFTNLVLVANKAEPESFHFEIEGDNYEFSEDKRTMYFRLESTKELFQNLGSDIVFDRYYTDVAAIPYTYELHYRTTETPLLLDSERRDYDNLYIPEKEFYGNNIYNIKSENKYDYRKIDRVYPIYSHGLVRLQKSTIFSLYYLRIDTYNDIYHKYLMMHDDSGWYDFHHLSGSEVSWNRDLNLFNIITHIKNSPIDIYGRLRGNSRYKEGIWDILIPPIMFMLKNEQWEPQTIHFNKEYKFFTICESYLDGPDILDCRDVIIPEPEEEKDYFKLCEENNLCSGKPLECYDSVFEPSAPIGDLYDNIEYFRLCEENNLCSGKPFYCPPSRRYSRRLINKIKEQEEKETQVTKVNSYFPPIVINSAYLPNDLQTDEVSSDKLPNIYSKFGYNTGAIQVDGWHVRKEAKIRDKWIKIRVRYSGKNLAVIHSLITLYNLSYS